MIRKCIQRKKENDYQAGFGFAMYSFYIKKQNCIDIRNQAIGILNENESFLDGMEKAFKIIETNEQAIRFHARFEEIMHKLNASLK